MFQVVKLLSSKNNCTGYSNASVNKKMQQDKIWDYFQVQSSDIFLQSAPRLNYLFRQVLAIYSHTKPRVLNIGVGNGWLEQKCMEQAWETYALDPSETTIALLEQRGIEGKVGYIEQIPYPDNFFDVVFCSEVIEHLSSEQIQQGLYEIERILKNSGLLVGTVPFKENLFNSQVICPDCGHIFHKWGHQQSFNTHSLAAIFSGNLKVEKLKVIYFVSWSSLNWKGVISALLKKCLSLIGLHGSNGNIFFISKKFV
ncbi:class I SAM-dependent methyltransferase [Coleofasciculus sp. FACHB-129]|nr:class I SAM-dependent methyltransferase [Coleofasciculus sp. FACHB-129]